MTSLYRYPTVIPSEGTICTIGNFDGLHLGHCELLRTMAGENALNLPQVIISFYPHPIEVLRPGTDIARITSYRSSLKILSERGVDNLYLVRFTKSLSELSPEEFLDKVLHRALNCKHLVVGPDLRIGRNRAGTPPVLQEECEKRGWGFTLVKPLLGDGEEKIGSRGVRERLEEGDVSGARELLGRDFVLEGKIVGGDKRGREIGFPTANLHLPHQFFLKKGVYAGYGIIGDKKYRAAINIGVRPTFGSGELKVEAHFIGERDLDLYGKRCELVFRERIRDEVQFESVSQLKDQIHSDIEKIEALL